MPAGSFTVTMDTPGLLQSIEARIIAPRDDCRIWAGAMDQGYGRVWVDGQAKRVHRVLWELKNGPIPEGLTVDHLCRVTACCNTEHMELVTAEENIRRAHAARSTHCKRGHEFTPENTYINKATDRRRCRACASERRESKAA